VSGAQPQVTEVRNVPCPRRCHASEAAPCHSPPWLPLLCPETWQEKGSLPPAYASSVLAAAPRAGGGGLCPDSVPVLCAGHDLRGGFTIRSAFWSPAEAPSLCLEYTALQKPEAYEEKMTLCDENGVFPFAFSSAVLWYVRSQCILRCSTVIDCGTFIY